jgi:thiosulfate/3-mercaptopyruvate sulfurtransferase
MKRATIIVATVLMIAWGSAIGSAADQKVRTSMIVSTDWLAEHLKDESLIMFHVGDKAEYEAGHIAGAQYITLQDISAPRGQGLILELAPVAQLQATFEKFGVTDKSRIVLYFGKDWVTPTARVFMVLDYLGLGDRTSILDGGLPAWRAAGKPAVTEVAQPKAGHFTPRPNSNLVVDYAWVNANLHKPNVAILDARNSKFYDGSDAGQMPRAGHIPGARSIPFNTLVDESSNKFKSPDELRTLFKTAGVSPGETVATYCHIGQQASLLYFVARYLGYDAHLYDGSFQDWSNRSDLPVEKSPNPK